MPIYIKINLFRLCHAQLVMPGKAKHLSTQLVMLSEAEASYLPARLVMLSKAKHLTLSTRFRFFTTFKMTQAASCHA